MAETDMDRKLNTVLLMQAEILGRLEALEQSLETTGDPMEDRLSRTTGLEAAPVYDDPRLEALHQIREAAETGSDKDLRGAVQEIVALTNHQS